MIAKHLRLKCKKVFSRIAVAAFIVLALISPVMVYAGTIQLRQTGQTTCYDPSGYVIPCAGTGQDADMQAGVAYANQFGSTTVIKGAFELVKYLNELEYMLTYPGFTSGEQPITPDIEIQGIIVVPSLLLRLPDVCQEKGCFPWVLFYQDQEENIPGVSGLHFGGIFKELFPIIVLSNTRLRFRPIVLGTVNSFFAVKRRAILYIMQPSDHSCPSGQMKCERDQVCYEVNQQYPGGACPFCSYCLACLDLESSQCACRDENGILPDGTPCRVMKAPDLVRGGECQSGECL